MSHQEQIKNYAKTKAIKKCFMCIFILTISLSFSLESQAASKTKGNNTVDSIIKTADINKGVIPFSKNLSTKQIYCPFCRWIVSKDLYICPNCEQIIPRIIQGHHPSEGNSIRCYFYDKKERLVRIEKDYYQYDKYIFGNDGRLVAIQQWSGLKHPHRLIDEKKIIYDNRGHLIEKGLKYKNEKIYKRGGATYRYLGEKLIEKREIRNLKSGFFSVDVYPWKPSHCSPVIHKTIYQYKSDGCIDQIIYTLHAPQCSGPSDYDKPPVKKKYIRVTKKITKFHYKDAQVWKAKIIDVNYLEYLEKEKPDSKKQAIEYIYFNSTKNCSESYIFRNSKNDKSIE